METLRTKSVKKVSSNIRLLMQDLLETMQLFEKRLRRLRIRINRNISELTVGLSPSEILELQKAIADDLS